MAEPQKNEISNIHESIIAATADMKAVAKSGHNDFGSYDYATLEDYVDVVAPVLCRHNLALSTSIDSVESLEDRKTNKGGVDHAVRVCMTMEVMNPLGQTHKITCVGDGQDRGDKAIYKAITGARKYGIACLFNLSTSDDAEDEKIEPRPRPPLLKSKPIKPSSSPPISRQDLLDAFSSRGIYSDSGAEIISNWMKDLGGKKPSLVDRKEMLDRINSGVYDTANLSS